MKLLRTPFKVPLGLFLVSALIGVWASYDPASSRGKFILICGSVALFLVAANLGGWVRTGTVWVALILSSMFAVYFATQHDFRADPAKLQMITNFGRLLNRTMPQFGFHVPQANIAAGLLEVALPLGLALAWQRLNERKIVESGFAMLSSAVLGFGLLLTSSRGAWLALGLVAMGTAAIYTARRALGFFHLSNRLLLPLLFDILLIGLLLLLHFWDAGKVLDFVGAITTGDRSISRLEVYGQAAQLVKDYPFTGSGLGVFPMVFSTYALLIDVPLLPHSHDLFLQIWIEQGILGFAAFGWLVIAFYLWVCRRRDQMNWLAIGSIMATTVLLLHGLFDVLFYSSRFLPLMFVPMGLGVAALRPLRGKRPRLSLVENKLLIAAGMGGLVTVLVIPALLRNSLTAVWYENLGSVEQTRVELSRYHFMDSLVEYVRRDADLTQAETDFLEALALDPGNVSANQRLASIALARGDYSRALDYAQTAQQREPNNAVTRELLGEAYLSVGQVDEAYTYWSGISDGAARLERLSQVRYQRDGDNQRAEWALALASRIRASSSQ